MKASTTISFLLAAASTAAALPLSKRIYIPEETRIATAYPEFEARVAQLDKRIYIPEETRISTAYEKLEAQVAKEEAKERV